MADARNVSILTGAAPRPVSIGAGICLTLVGATTEARYSTGQCDMTPPPEIQDLSWQAEDVAGMFREHMTAWKAEMRVSPSSKIQEMILSEHYQRIIGMGWKAVPYLLAECEISPDHWDWALEMITGENPVPESAAGKISEISRAWIDWGRVRRLV